MGSPDQVGPVFPDAENYFSALTEVCREGEGALLRRVMKTVACALEADRAAVWELEEGAERLRAVCHYRRDGDDFPTGGQLQIPRHVRLIEPLRNGETLAVESVDRDVRTRSLAGTYLRNDREHALLAAPVRVGDSFRGVLWVEERGATRAWTPLERDVVEAGAGSLAAVFEAGDGPGSSPSAGRSRELRRLFEKAPVGIAVHRDGELLYVNPKAAEFAGARSANDLVGRSILEFVHPEDREVARERIRQLEVERKGTPPMEMRSVGLDCADRWVEVTGIPITFQGKPAVQSVFRDITHQKWLEGELDRRERVYRSLFKEVGDAVYITERSGRIVEVNPAMERMLGYTQEEFRRLDARDLYARPESREDFKEPIEEGGAVEEYEVWLRRKDGSAILCRVTATVRTDAEGKVEGYQGIVRDVTEDVRSEEELRYRVHHDALTRLPNRSLFWDRLLHAVSRDRRSGSALAVLFLDIDGFKEVNDRLGHPAGDRVLREVADRMAAVVRKADTVGRYGGDEFAILLEDLEEPESDARRVVERLAASIGEPIEVEGDPVRVSCSVGVALSQAGFLPETEGEGTAPVEPVEVAETLLRRADAAMYEAKRGEGEGDGRCAFFEPETG